MAVASRMLRLRSFHGRKRRCAMLPIVPVLFCLILTGCLPDNAQDPQGRTVHVTTNLASKSDRLKIGRSDAESDLQLATTATVVPASATDSAAYASADAPPTSAPDAMSGFFSALRALDRGERSEPVTILHLGDEHIAADRMTASLRESFQTRFGDAGRGFMAPGLFRVAGAKIERRGEWRAASSTNGDAGPFGITGVRLTGRNGATLSISTPDRPFDWAEVTFATGPATGNAYVAVGSKGDTVKTRTATANWQRIRINAGGSSLKVRAEGGGPIHLLSWSLRRERPGVRFINLGLPRATGLTHHRWSEKLLRADLAHMSPDLIIVGYGSNEAFSDSLDAEEYRKGLNALLTKLKAAVPDTSFLVIGPPDLARMPGFAAAGGADACRALTAEERANYQQLMRTENARLGRWHPPPALRAVRRSLRNVANQNEVFFWDWSRFMGGLCSIHAWVHANPPLATADHRHFTAEGARRTATALFRALMQAYEAYEDSLAKAQK